MPQWNVYIKIFQRRTGVLERLLSKNSGQKAGFVCKIPKNSDLINLFKWVSISLQGGQATSLAHDNKEQRTAGGPEWTQMTTIEERIKELRKKNRLTQDGAASKFHTNKSTWSRIEKGKRDPSLQLVEQICREWHVSADYLLFGKKDTENRIDLSGLSFSHIHAVKEIVDGLRRS